MTPIKGRKRRRYHSNGNQWFDICVHLRNLRFNVLTGPVACGFEPRWAAIDSDPSCTRRFQTSDFSQEVAEETEDAHRSCSAPSACSELVEGFPPVKWFGLSWVAAEDRGVPISIWIAHVCDDFQSFSSYQSTTDFTDGHGYNPRLYPC